VKIEEVQKASLLGGEMEVGLSNEALSKKPKKNLTTQKPKE